MLPQSAVAAAEMEPASPAARRALLRKLFRTKLHHARVAEAAHCAIVQRFADARLTSLVSWWRWNKATLATASGHGQNSNSRNIQCK
jgi:hypothetical protein